MKNLKHMEILSILSGQLLNDGQGELSKYSYDERMEVFYMLSDIVHDIKKYHLTNEERKELEK